VSERLSDSEISSEANRTVYESLNALVGYHLGQLPDELQQKVRKVRFGVQPVIKGRYAIHQVDVTPPTRTGTMCAELHNTVFGISAAFNLHSGGDLNQLGNPDTRIDYNLSPDDLVSDFSLYHPLMRTASPTVELELRPYS